MQAPSRVLTAPMSLASSVLTITGVDTTLRCTVGPGARPWLVRLTPAAVAAMGLAEGRVVWLAVKSHSVRLV